MILILMVGNTAWVAMQIYDLLEMLNFVTVSEQVLKVFQIKNDDLIEHKEVDSTKAFAL